MIKSRGTFLLPMILTLFILMLSVISIHGLGAASAVAYSSEAYGYSFNVDTVEEAEEMARKMCAEHGGREIQILISTDQRGYGAIAADGNVVGAVVGYPDLRSATARALSECVRQGCKQPRIVATWFDRGY